MGKRIGLATIVGFVVLMILGFLIYGLLFKDLMNTMYATAGDCMNLKPGFIYIAFATLVQALFLAYILAGFNTTSFRTGLMTGGWTFLLLSLMMGIWMMASFSFYTAKSMLYDVIFNVFQAGIAGGVMGYVLGRMK